MSATARAMLGSVKVADNAVSASYEGVWDVDRQRRLVAEAVAGVAVQLSTRSRGVVVELKPRHFSETAEHFLRVATPIDWPTDEPDID